MNLCTSPKPVRTFAIEQMESRRLLSISIGALGAVAHPNLHAAQPAKACEESHETSGVRRLEHFHPHGEVEFAMSLGSPHAREVGGGVEVQVQISVNGSLPPPAPVPVTRLDSAGPEAAA